MKTGHFLLALAALGLSACGGGEPAPATAAGEPVEASVPAAPLETAVAGAWRLEQERARDKWRHPVETLNFFGIKPSDTVFQQCKIGCDQLSRQHNCNDQFSSTER